VQSHRLGLFLQSDWLDGLGLLGGEGLVEPEDLAEELDLCLEWTSRGQVAGDRHAQAARGRAEQGGQLVEALGCAQAETGVHDGRRLVEREGDSLAIDGDLAVQPGGVVASQWEEVELLQTLDRVDGETETDELGREGHRAGSLALNLASWADAAKGQLVNKVRAFCSLGWLVLSRDGLEGGNKEQSGNDEFHSCVLECSLGLVKN